jgi:hypothetical protein
MTKTTKQKDLLILIYSILFGKNGKDMLEELYEDTDCSKKDRR